MFGGKELLSWNLEQSKTSLALMYFLSQSRDHSISRHKWGCFEGNFAILETSNIEKWKKMLKDGFDEKCKERATRSCAVWLEDHKRKRTWYWYHQQSHLPRIFSIKNS